MIIHVRYGQVSKTNQWSKQGLTTHYDIKIKTVETRNHFKNGAELKSQKSKENYI